MQKVVSILKSILFPSFKNEAISVLFWAIVTLSTIFIPVMLHGSAYHGEGGLNVVLSLFLTVGYLGANILKNIDVE